MAAGFLLIGVWKELPTTARVVPQGEPEFVISHGWA